MPTAQKKEIILSVRNLNQYFNEGKKNEVRAINNVSFDIYKGETFGLVGESGSGKSTTGRAILKLNEITSGNIIFDNKGITNLNGRKETLKFRKSMQMIFQDPYASLNPKMSVMDIIGGALDIHKMTKSKKERTERIYELLEAVGLSREYTSRYPKEFSGGQCQRIGIARALAVKPDFIIADEAISALDVSIQAQVVNLLKKLKQERDLTYMFIAHDLSMVKYISDRIAVMNEGRILELADSDDLYRAPLHPYTESLLSAVPTPDPDTERNRKRIYYDKKYHNYEDETQVRLNEIAPNHFVYCHKDEISLFKKKYNSLRKKVYND